MHSYIKAENGMMLLSNIIQGTLTNEEHLSLIDRYTVILDLGTDGRVLKYMLMSNPNNKSDDEIAKFANKISSNFGYERDDNLFIIYGD